MSEVDYLETPLHLMKEVKTHDKNVPLYYIAMFSKHPRAYDLWKKALTLSIPTAPLTVLLGGQHVAWHVN